MLRRNLVAVLLVVAIGSCAADDSSTAVDAFSRCIVEGGGTVTGDVELAMHEGRALAVIGSDVEASEALLAECLGVASAD